MKFLYRFSNTINFNYKTNKNYLLMIKGMDKLKLIKYF